MHGPDCNTCALGFADLHYATERIGDAIGAAVIRAIADAYAYALANGITYVNPDSHADDDPTADTAY